MRKLSNRKKRASKGRAIRVSDLVYDTLNKQRYSKSWDALLRRMLGLPSRTGFQQILIEGVLETMTGRFFLKHPEDTWDLLMESAYEIAILTAARAKKKQVSRPIRMRELA